MKYSLLKNPPQLRETSGMKKYYNEPPLNSQGDIPLLVDTGHESLHSFNIFVAADGLTIV